VAHPPGCTVNRLTICTGAGALLYFVVALSGSVAAQQKGLQDAYPSQTIKLMVPASAGGLPDTVARILSQGLQQRLGQSIVVENRTGGNASIAVAALMASPADGYTFIVQDGSIVSINPQFYTNLTYRPQDLAPVALIARAPLFLAIHPKIPVETMKEFIAYVKSNPGKLNYGSSGLGSTHHLSMESIKATLDLDMIHVPYKGTGEAVQALLGGHVEVLFSAYPSLKGLVEDRRVKLLATNGARRSAQAPGIPTVAESIPGFDFAPMIGIYARIGTPPLFIQRIGMELAELLKETDIIRRFTAAGIEPVGADSAIFTQALISETARVSAVMKASGIKAQ
jgi:tripartite-type tricarboxylate transporter receptor subunit TctC